ncbi:MAG: hypothetical protein R8F63_09605 [Acidimicrobiales bacterium]|nr:hypothetical protein [Acidimicrobiales bacterium]
MRQILPYLFWPWFATSCFILLRRRVTIGSWRPMPEADDDPSVRFPPLPPAPVDETVPDETVPDKAVPDSAVPDNTVPDDSPPAATPKEPGTVATKTAPVARSLAEALDGIAMPCDLAPLIGTGEPNPREIAFFTSGVEAATVGRALSDEFERLGYEITPLDDTSIRAEHGPNLIRARLVSAALTSDDVMHELHPSAPAGALVVELKLT